MYTTKQTATPENRNSALILLAGHMNAPYGNVITTEHLAAVLRAGSFEPVAKEKLVSAILHWLFIENSPELIVKSAYEAGTDVRHANRLYEETLKAGLVRVPEWEKSIQFLV